MVVNRQGELKFTKVDFIYSDGEMTVNNLESGCLSDVWDVEFIIFTAIHLDDSAVSLLF